MEEYLREAKRERARTGEKPSQYERAIKHEKPIPGERARILE